ncbi:CotH kinase family protein [Haliscomenobacter hydrossis]|uniref:Spore coat protein CotH n=1 Tax=Haliscomenobacter hydrossis (strain ATCC 27775 / DSM 1100 / LMG 10767 / O) TaxID=760192 RepID=F4KQ78_HALH1|nr:CotH kinase family protein [Haliscomenobacter hydrossis]AEE54239.1 Spore coat protein CotH [Haliscomenobacter hydrossis DSM 1100]
MNRTFTLFFILLAVAKFSLLQAQSGANKDFFDPQTIQEIDLTFKSEKWRYLLDSLRYNGDGLLNAELKVNGKSFGRVGIRIRESGGFQPGNQRNNLHIQLDNVSSGQQLQGYKSIRLSSALRDPSMVREVLATDIASKFMPAPKANYANLTINGKYYGLMVNIEPFEAPFFERYFQSNNGAFYYCPAIRKDTIVRAGCLNGGFGTLQLEKNESCYGDNFVVVQGDGLRDLAELSRILNQSPAQIESILDVDRTLWMLAYNNVLINLYSYSGGKSTGYYLYKDADGRFAPLIGDFNFTFGSYKSTGRGSDLSLLQLQQMDPMLNVDNTLKPLINKLLSNPHYAKVYLSHLRTILFSELLTGAYETRAKQLQEFIKPALANDANKAYSNTDFDRSLIATIGRLTQIPGIVELMNERVRFLKRHPALAVLPPVVSDVKAKHREKFVASPMEEFQLNAKISEFATKVTVFYRYNNRESFKTAMMHDDGQHHDEKAGDFIYGVSLKPNSGNNRIEYYIQAENVKAIAYSPERYMFERHSATLEEINK